MVKVIEVYEYGGPEVLKWEDVEVCEPKEGETRVKNKAVGLNFIDEYIQKGVYKSTLPFTPGGDFQHNVTRFTLPIRSLAFNKFGTLLDAVGDDEGIKLIATIDGSISRVLKGHRGSVTGLAFDPTGEYLAFVDGIGTVIYWELSSGKPIHTLKGIAPDSGSDDSVLNIVSWSPDGEKLAVPGLVL